MRPALEWSFQDPNSGYMKHAATLVKEESARQMIPAHLSSSPVPTSKNYPETKRGGGLIKQSRNKSNIPCPINTASGHLKVPGKLRIWLQSLVWLGV